MPPLALIAALALFGSGHAGNMLLRSTIAEGLSVGGATVKLPEPTFRDGLTAAEQRAALRGVAGSDRGLDEMLADSIAAPHRLVLRDLKTDGATLRAGDLTFVVRIDLDAIKPDEALRSFRGGPVEAGNMKVESRILTSDDLKGAPALASPSPDEWFSHSTARLLDRIAVESTDRIVATRAPDSLVLAARTDPRFGPVGRWPNAWSSITTRGADATPGPRQPFPGGIGYVKITRLASIPRAAVVEAHFAFAEPLAWFDGAPILRSKFSLIAQDQIRRLRRDLKKAEATPSAPPL